MKRSNRSPSVARAPGARRPRSSRAPAEKRARLVDTAARLAYAKGFHRTSLADIARESGVPLGNVYYYFKTKDEIGDALVARLAESFAEKRAEWESLGDPRARLAAFVDMTADNGQALVASGCPVGTLCSELHKEGGALARRAARILGDSLAWMEAQLAEMGRRKDAPELAAHLLSALEGVSLLTHAFHDERYVVREAARLKEWIRGL